ncbi:MFS transporter MCT family solute carrier family 16 (monocarboxylic acid transporters) member 3 [Microdochium nivale]|nr:MFS transporter MCT family solute carrier family 16 (monocarboxylic acid transporters) member 3 [Microdochium nivale]
MAVGRLASGFACDALGATNILLLAIVSSGVTTLCLWYFASTLPTLYAFSVLNGITTGAYFMSQPTAAPAPSASPSPAGPRACSSAPR